MKTLRNFSPVLFALGVAVVFAAMIYSPPAHAQASGQSTTAVLDAFAFETIAVSTIAIGPTSATYAPSGQASAKRAYCTVNSNTVRVRYDGTNPSSTVGHVYAAASSFQLDGINNIVKLKFIRASADATVDCTYLR